MYAKPGAPTMLEQPSNTSTATSSTMGLVPSQSEGNTTSAVGGGNPSAGGDRGGGRCLVEFWGVVPMFMMTLAAFVLLTLTTFSLPFLPGLYFLRVSQAGGVRFGIWGWCLEEGSVCSDELGMGYTWEPEVSIPITKALALYPIAAISVLMMLIAFVPVIRDKSGRTLRIFAAFAWTSFALSFVVFVFMIAMWSVADERFKVAGWKVHWGPLPWMSFIATLVLFIVALNTWRGALAPPSSTSSSSFQDPPHSAEGWSTTAEEDHQKLGADCEKALKSPTPRHAPLSSSRFSNESTIPPRPSRMKEVFGQDHHHNRSTSDGDLYGHDTAKKRLSDV